MSNQYEPESFLDGLVAWLITFPEARINWQNCLASMSANIEIHPTTELPLNTIASFLIRRLFIIKKKCRLIIMLIPISILAIIVQEKLFWYLASRKQIAALSSLAGDWLKQYKLVTPTDFRRSSSKKCWFYRKKHCCDFEAGNALKTLLRKNQTVFLEIFQASSKCGWCVKL